MKLANFKKLFKNDFNSDDQPLVEQLSEIINYNFRLLYEALNQNLTFSENFSGIIKEVNVTVDANGLPITPIRIKSDLVPSRPSGAIVTDHNNLTNPDTYPTGAIMISFNETGGVISINHITGLQANNVYKLKINFFA